MVLDGFQGFRGQKVIGLWRAVGTDWVPLNKKWCNPERRIGGFEYWRPGGLEALLELW
jgi:hypothetical protein